MTTKFQLQEQQEAKDRLRELCKPGDTLYTILRHCSRSGMSRRISVLTKDHHQLDYLIARAGLYKTKEREEGLVVGGCGMDMGFAIVYDLGRSLWPKGTPEPHNHRNGEPDSDGGYALRHRWL